MNKTCLLCLLPLSGGDDLCPACDLFVEPGAFRCIFCQRPQALFSGKCPECCRDNFKFDGLRFAAWDTGSAEFLIRQYKFGSQFDLAEFWAERLQRAALIALPLVPVPPNPANHKHRGWDPVQLICQKLAAKMGTKVWNLLTRTGSKSQKELGREDRQANLSGRITVKTQLNLPRQVWLVDDILTTGATLEVCAEALHRAGISSVKALVAARRLVDMN